MKKKTIFNLIFVAMFPFGCTSNKQLPDDLPFIDVRKNYPEKEIVLTDIADVSYLHLNTQNDDFLHKGGIWYETENLFLVVDLASNSILFFSKDGNPKARFNRYGQGPEEYIILDYQNVIYDEETDDVFVPVGVRNIIQVYSSTGEYKRKIILPDGVNRLLGSIIVSFDNQSLLVFNVSKQWNKIERIANRDPSVFSPQLYDSSFVLISKMDGKVLKYVEVPSPSTVISNRIILFKRITRCVDGFLLCNPENDTVYLYKNDKTLTPILRKIPLMSESAKIVLDGCLDTGRYQFMSVSKISEEGQNNRTAPVISVTLYYLRDKETGEVFRQKIVLPDYKGKEFFIYAYGGFTRYLENGYQFHLSLTELKKAEKENRLSGKLKELVATLNEDTDNDIFMFVKFK